MFKKILWSSILQLDHEKSQLFYKYCKLVCNNKTSISPVDKTKMMIEIWNEAIQDHHLADCLELVDYFIDSEPLESNLNKRAYIQDYLLMDVENLIMNSGKKDLLEKQKESVCKEKKDLIFDSICHDSFKKKDINLGDLTSELITELTNNTILEAL